MEKGLSSFIIFLIIIILLFALAIFAQKRPGKYTSFAQCLADSGTIFYGAWWCPACARQKGYFGRAADDLPYLECAERGSRGLIDIDVCVEKKISQTPTWEFPYTDDTYGILPKESIAYLSGCGDEFPEGEKLSELTGEEVFESINRQVGIKKDNGDDDRWNIFRNLLTDTNGLDLSEKTGPYVAAVFAETQKIARDEEEVEDTVNLIGNDHGAEDIQDIPEPVE